MMVAHEGILRVGCALPDPPFDVLNDDGTATGFDVDLMAAMCEHMGLRFEPVRFEGEHFEDIFTGLHNGAYDCIASGTTITSYREGLGVLFCEPYIRSGQSLVVNVQKSGHPASIDDLADCTIGIQKGNTSDLIARKLHAEGRLKDIRYYAYHDLLVALGDLEEERIDGFMKLAPVMRWMTRSRPRLGIVQEGLSVEDLALAVRKGNDALQSALNEAQRALVANGTVPALLKKWVS